MSATPDISTKVYVVTPSYNAAETLDHTITSVVTQAGDFDLYYHVQDGGSTDQTIDILKSWAARITEKAIPFLCKSITFTYESKPDSGLYDAIVKGFQKFQLSPDDWMGWINADDLLLPGALALLRQVDISQRHIKWISGSAGVIKNEVIVANELRPLASAAVKEGICDGRHWGFVRQEGVFFRNIVWRNTDVEKQFRVWRYAGDWNLWRCMAQKYRLFQVDRPLGLFRIRAGQLSQQFRNEYEAEIEEALPAGKRLTALRRVAGSEVERSVIVFRGENSAASFVTESLVPHANQWLERRVGARHDADWQFPAITEKCAMDAVWRSIPATDSCVYLAFPWATLIDLIDHRSDHSALSEALEIAIKKLPPGARVVTVCQHIRMLMHRNLFEKAGVTDIFWSHTSRGQRVWPGKRPIGLRPFPLYPVQVPKIENFYDDEVRPHLFSFVGAAANNWYLSEVRAWLIQLLSDDPRGIVIGRDNWHYNKVVYGHQITKREKSAEKLVDQAASDQFRDLLRASTFALCPSGSGPNSIRLWEAIGAGSIPVILADSYAPPGDAALWQEAAVFCSETEEAVRGLPDRLEALATDPAAIARKRRALRQLWLLYGPDNFIHDIRRFYMNQATRSLVEAQKQPANAAEAGARRIKVALLGRHGNRTPLSYPAYEPFFAQRFEMVKRLDDADLILTGFDLDLRENIETVARLRARKPGVRFAVVSEEPLWDTVWSKGFRDKTATLTEKGITVSYAVINHTNSTVFDFDRIPYFVTTTDEYGARYNHLFTRNAQLSPEAVVEQWRNAAIPAAFYAEKREDPRYDVKHADVGIQGLSVFRSQLSASCQREGVVRVGAGWGETIKRQALADWHLDKLAALDGKAFLVSAIENTHQRSYVTEKIFDAFAVGGLPLYYAAPNHAVHRLVRGFVNLHGSTPQEAADRIGKLSPNLDLAKAWVEAQEELASRFSDPALLAAERQRLAKNLTTLLVQVAEGAWPGLNSDVKDPAPAAAKPVLVSAEPPAIAAKSAVAAVAVVASEAPKKAKAPQPASPSPAPKPKIVAPAMVMQSTKKPEVAKPTGKNELQFRDAAIVEKIKFNSGYEHINIRVADLKAGDLAIQRAYFKLQKLKDDEFGLEFVERDFSSASSSRTWTAKDGSSVSKIGIFFGSSSKGKAVWSLSPAQGVHDLICSIMNSLPQIMDRCEKNFDGQFPEVWKQAVKILGQESLRKEAF